MWVMLGQKWNFKKAWADVLRRETVYARGMGEQYSLRDFNKKNLLSYELLRGAPTVSDHKA